MAIDGATATDGCCLAEVEVALAVSFFVVTPLMLVVV